MSNAIVLMTALVPTTGHQYLIDFAESLVMNNIERVHVIVGTLTREPVEGKLRVNAIIEHYKSNPRVIVHHLYRDVPQEPSEHPNFWIVWRDIVREFVNVKHDDYFVASELYGMNMADALGCKFMTCNRYRETIDISGTKVRNDLYNNFEFILPTFQKHIRKTVTIFGAESCGKTTMTKYLAYSLNGWFIPEWAREYLETVGSDITDGKMRDIIYGQAALQKTGSKLMNKPFVFQDTDLFSTVGYYRLWGGGSNNDLDIVEYNAKKLKSDLYIVMNDNIPFEKDPLRYGGNKRESKTQFWIDLLEEFKLPYYVVKSVDHSKQNREVCLNVIDFFDRETAYIREYKRDGA